MTNIMVKMSSPKQNFLNIKYEYKQKMQFLKWFTVPVGWRNQYCGVFQYEYKGVIYKNKNNLMKALLSNNCSIDDDIFSCTLLDN